MKKIAISFLFIPFFSLASNIDVYSCNTCNYQQAVKVAEQHFQAPSCHWEKPGYQEEFGGGGYVCKSAKKELIVANPDTKIAYKFQVTTSAEFDFTTTVKELSLSSKEQSLLDSFYSIDKDIKSALKSISNTEYNQSSVLWVSASSDICKNSPISYFQDPRTVHKDFSNKLTAKMRSSSWHDFITDTEFTGGGLTIEKGGIGAKFSFQHNEMKNYISKIYGNSLDNILVFEVNYAGEINFDGKRQINFNYSLQRGASFIDGIEVDMLFGTGSQIDTTKTLLSNCVLDYIKKKGTIESGSSSGGGMGGNDSGSNNGGGMCLNKYNVTTCSTVNGDTHCTNASFIVPC
ncbi:hypothetical protein [Shewanella sp. YIC-542]|uniref:hypothetical protein n=1 Tax=Shewanella mytili TaxID=3377111 RepID=UPI00398F4ABE